VSPPLAPLRFPSMKRLILLITGLGRGKNSIERVVAALRAQHAGEDDCRTYPLRLTVEARRGDAGS
jgi:hypothetical protein